MRLVEPIVRFVFAPIFYNRINRAALDDSAGAEMC